MLTAPFRRCNQFRHINGVVAISNGNFGQVVSNLAQGHVRSYSKDKGCCPDTPQAEGKKIEPWPKSDPPPPAWRCECPRDPQPPNYDPYRIKVPDVVVPPLPSSNAKEIPFEDDRELFKSPEINLAANSNIHDLFHDSPIIHPDYWKDKAKRGLLPAAPKDPAVFPRLGYHGKSKYKFAFHEPWKPLDRVSLIAQAEKEELEMAGAIDAAEKIDKQGT